MNKKILFLVLLTTAIVFPLSSLAQTPESIINHLSSQLQLLSGGLATIAFIVAGIMFLTATGNPGRMQIAKGALIAGIIGIIIIILAPIADTFVSDLFGL